MKTIHKTAKTVKPYKTMMGGWEIVIPTGSTVSNKTAMGYDDRYRFWSDYHKIAKELTGFDNSTLLHDLTHYGINIPAKYCEPYNLE